MEAIHSGTMHHGQNIKRIRDLLGVKQEAIAIGLNISQQALSKLERKEQIDDAALGKISEILKIPVEAIKNFNEDLAFNVIANNTFHDSSFIDYKPTFDPIDKLIELYERLLKTEQEKNALLEKISSLEGSGINQNQP
jgi:transcriptional regulator with XRE-family HTH domain